MNLRSRGPSKTSTVTKAAIYKTTTDYLNQASPELQGLYADLRSELLGQGDDVQEKTLKYYVAFKRLKNFACLAGGAFNEGADGGLVLFAGDQVAFPVSRHCPVIGFSWSFGDVDHASHIAAAFSGPAGLAQRPPGAKTTGQLAAQPTTALDIQTSVDRFVAHAHGRIVGKQQLEASADLLWAVFGIQPSLHVIAEPVVQRKHPLLRTPGSLVRQRLRDRGPKPDLRRTMPRLSSRLIVEGERSSALAIDRTPSPAARRQLISTAFLERQTANSGHGSASTERFGHHPSNLPEPPPRNSLGNADSCGRLGYHQARANCRPELPLNLHMNCWSSHTSPQSSKVLQRPVESTPR